MHILALNIVLFRPNTVIERRDPGNIMEFSHSYITFPFSSNNIHKTLENILNALKYSQDNKSGHFFKYFRSVRLRELALPTRRAFDVQLGSGSRARVQLFLPPSWREELRDAAFPVLVHV